MEAKVIAIGSSDEKVKNIIKGKFDDSNIIVVDDLFTLSLEECKTSALQYMLICEDLITSEEAKEIANYYKSKIDCYSISQKTFEKISAKQTCAGMVLVTKINQATPPAKEKGNLTILVCDALEISGNIGTIFRTAEATKVDYIIFCNQKAKIIDNKVLHASRGMIFCVPFKIVETTLDAIKLLNQLNAHPIICEPEQGTDFKAFEYNGNTALIVGSERYGVDKKWFEHPNAQFLKIPMFGKMDSLNVAVATSLILYEAKYFKLNKLKS